MALSAQAVSQFNTQGAVGGYFIGGPNGAGAVAVPGAGQRTAIVAVGDVHVGGRLLIPLSECPASVSARPCVCEVRPVVLQAPTLTPRCEVRVEAAPQAQSRVWESPLFGGCVAVAFLLGIATRRLWRG